MAPTVVITIVVMVSVPHCLSLSHKGTLLILPLLGIEMVVILPLLIAALQLIRLVVVIIVLPLTLTVKPVLIWLADELSCALGKRLIIQSIISDITADASIYPTQFGVDLILLGRVECSTVLIHVLLLLSLNLRFTILQVACLVGIDQSGGCVLINSILLLGFPINRRCALSDSRTGLKGTKKSKPKQSPATIKF